MILSTAFLLLALQGAEEPIVTTRHQVTVAGRTLRYTARAGRLPIRENEAGEVRGNMFFVSYSLDRPAGARARPLTFLWNGGPGSNAALVHLIGFGPRRMVPPAQGGAGAGARWVIQPNPGTWLDETDLVFVDPIGTGYSRATKVEYTAEFYNTRGDAESVAEFIRTYRARFDAFDAPLFLAGESFGVVRAAGVAGALQARRIDVRGLILIGLALPFGEPPHPLRVAFTVPTMAVAAFTHGKLAPELQRDLSATQREAERWAIDEYAPALARIDSLTDGERDRVVRGLSRFTGLPEALIDRKSLVVNRMQLGNALLRREGKFVGQYDTRRVAGLDTTQAIYDPKKDSSLIGLLDDVMVLRYYRNELGYHNDLQYQGPWGESYPPPTSFRGDWMALKWNRQPQSAVSQPVTPPGTSTLVPAYPLRATMLGNPAMRVLVGCGIYDLLCDTFGNAHVAASLEPSLRPRVEARAYAGGHALYTDPGPHLQFKRDVARFIRETLGTGPRGASAAGPAR